MLSYIIVEISFMQLEYIEEDVSSKQYDIYRSFAFCKMFQSLSMKSDCHDKDAQFID